MLHPLCRSVVMVPDPKLDASYHKEADEVLTSLMDFNPSNWGLPPFQDITNWEMLSRWSAILAAVPIAKQRPTIVDWSHQRVYLQLGDTFSSLLQYFANWQFESLLFIWGYGIPLIVRNVCWRHTFGLLLAFHDQWWTIVGHVFGNWNPALFFFTVFSM